MRNKVIFNDRNVTFEDNFPLILYHFLNWLKSKDEFFMVTGTNLLIGLQGIIDWSNNTK
jgi:hypothetical protein